MSDVDVSGSWIGSIHGTNQGRIFLKVEQDGDDVEVQLNISDYDTGIYGYFGKGRIEGETFMASLSPKEGVESIDLGQVTVGGTLKTDGELDGEWSSSIGTAGTFLAQRPPAAGEKSSSKDSLKTAFIIMKIASDDAEAEDVLMTIKSACEDLDIEAERVDEIEHSGKITVLVLKAIREKDVMICDLTNERPNVYYELGYAHGIGQEVILLAKKETTVHFDVKDYNVIFYRNMTALAGKLKDRLNSMTSRSS